MCERHSQEKKKKTNEREGGEENQFFISCQMMNQNSLCSPYTYAHTYTHKASEREREGGEKETISKNIYIVNNGNRYRCTVHKKYRSQNKGFMYI